MSIKTFKLCLIIFFSLGVVRSMEWKQSKFHHGQMNQGYTEQENKKNLDESENIYLNVIFQKETDLIEFYFKQKNTIKFFEKINFYIECFAIENLKLIYYTVNCINNKSLSINYIMKSHQQKELENIINLINRINHVYSVVNEHKDKFLLIDCIKERINTIEKIKEKFYKQNYSTLHHHLSINGYEINSYHSGYTLLIYSNNFSKPIDNPVTQRNIQILQSESADITTQLKDKLQMVSIKPCNGKKK